MRYAEHDNILFRGEAPPGFPLGEKMVGGKWVPAGMAGHAAAHYGRPVDEDEAKSIEADGGENAGSEPAPGVERA